MEHFRLSGEIDLSNVARTCHELLEYAQCCDERVVIDCSQLEFIDSTGLHMLVDVRTGSGKELELRDVPDKLAKVFQITGLDKMFGISADGAS